MIILGVDTAMRCTGYGVLEVIGDNFNVLDCGVIKNQAQKSRIVNVCGVFQAGFASL